MITYPRFVLEVYLDGIIQHVVVFNCPPLGFCLLLNYSMRRQRVGFEGHIDLGWNSNGAANLKKGSWQAFFLTKEEKEEKILYISTNLLSRAQNSMPFCTQSGPPPLSSTIIQFKLPTIFLIIFGFALTEKLIKILFLTINKSLVLGVPISYFWGPVQ